MHSLKWSIHILLCFMIKIDRVRCTSLPSTISHFPNKKKTLPTKVTKGWPGEGETSIIPSPPPVEELLSRRVPFTGDTGASHTCADTRLPRGPAFTLTPNCARSRNVARFNARDSKASGTQWEGRAHTSCSVKQAKKTTDFAGRWGGGEKRM